MDPRALYEEHLDSIERIARWICKRKALDARDAEDFVSWAHVRLLEDDCAIVAKYKGKSRFTTYLTTVLSNLYKDYAISKSVKWRSSAIARSLGWQAEALEKLLVYHGYELHDAARVLRERCVVQLTDDEIADLAAKLPRRYRYQEVEAESIAEPTAPDDVGRNALEREAQSVVDRLSEVLRTAIADFSEEDRFIMLRRFRDGLRVVEIASLLEVEARTLYTRIDRLVRELRRRVEPSGIEWDHAKEVLGWQFDVRIAEEDL